jgi:hypothetical protein
MFAQRRPVVNRKAALIELGQKLAIFVGVVSGFLSILSSLFTLRIFLVAC